MSIVGIKKRETKASLLDIYNTFSYIVLYKVHKMPLSINIYKLSYFFELNKLAALKLLIIIENHFSGNFHKEDIKEICTILNCSPSYVYTLLRQLQKLNWVKKETKNWWHTISWRRKCNNPKNKVIDLDEELLKTQGVKYLRTQYYLFHYKCSFHVSKKNARKTQAVNDACPRGFYPVSSSFVKSVTGIDKSEKTLLKHLNRANEMNLVFIYQKEDRTYFNNYLDMLNYWINLQDNSYQFKKIKINPPKITGKFVSKQGSRSVYIVYKYLSNCISF